jgi:hypothetical protein
MNQILSMIEEVDVKCKTIKEKFTESRFAPEDLE